MKKLLFALIVSGFAIACTDTPATDSGSADTTAASAITPAPAADSGAVATTTPMKDSLMQYKEGKVMIMAGGAWTVLSAAVTTTNGRKVTPAGEVSKGGKSRKMEDGMMIDKDGQLMDKDGKMMDNTGWE